ncbi:MAG: extracellular solute-binding protein, partial [Eubacteriales bacterium]|nr:extracellular solute-binding protein [Eubacteriales bacterium]
MAFPMAISATADGAQVETVPMRYVIPGSAPGVEGQAEIVFAAVNEKLQADGVGIEFQLTTIPWDAWDQKTSLMLATGEPFDLLHVMEDQKGFANYVGQEALLPLTELIETYGQNIKKVIPDWMWDGAKVGGEIYAVPAYWTENTTATEGLTIRTDWLEEYGIATPETAEELFDAIGVFQENWTGDGTPYFIQLYAEPARYLYRTFDTYPFTLIEQLICVRQDGTVEAWIDTEEFKMEAEFARKSFEAGYVNPDILSVPSEWRGNEADMGRYLYRDGNGLHTSLWLEQNGIEEDVIVLAPEKPSFRDMGFRNDNVVPASSENPEAAVKFLDWIYANQENYDLFIYGIEGTHYNLPEDAVGLEREILLNEEGSSLYTFHTWMIGNLQYTRAGLGDHPTRIAIQDVYDADAVNSVTVGFQFDATDVSVEYANCLAEVKSSLYPMKVGIQSYEEGIEAARSNFAAAGIDAVIEEYERQLTEWLASK